MPNDRPGGMASAQAWIDSPALPGIVAQVAGRYGFVGPDVQDLIQETRIALWDTGTKKVGPSWIARVAEHKSIDLLRRTTRIRARDRTLVCLTEPGWEEPDLAHLLHAKVDELPTRLRQFYELHYIQGLSEREAAKRLGRCRSSVRWLDDCVRRAILG